MSNPQAWLTPETAPALKKCWRVLVPDGEKWEAAFRGALALLGMAENWELFGALTPDETAQEFIDNNFLTFEMRSCMPVGVIQSFGGDVLPDGWLWCDGTAYANDGDYENLYDVIGYNFGQSGTDFKVPNMVNKFYRHVASGSAAGGSSGKDLINIAVSNLPSHNHSIPSTLVALTPLPAGVVPVLTPGILPLTSGNTGGGTPLNNKPPYVNFHSIINYR